MLKNFRTILLVLLLLLNFGTIFYVSKQLKGLNKKLLSVSNQVYQSNLPQVIYSDPTAPSLSDLQLSLDDIDNEVEHIGFVVDELYARF